MDRHDTFDAELETADLAIPDFDAWVDDTPVAPARPAEQRPSPLPSPEGADETSEQPAMVEDPTPAPASPENTKDRRRETPHSPARRRTCCLTFQGVGGGSGTTSLAIATAFQLSRRAQGQVCIVDLDFELGAIAHYLDIGSVPRMDDMRTDPSRIDETYVRALVSHHESGLAVLASPSMAGGNDLANPAAVIAMLDRLSEMYPILILDLPRTSKPWTQAAMMAADEIVLVSELHIPALHLARQALSRIENGEMGSAKVVINKYEHRSFKASIRIADAERALGRKVDATIGLDMQGPFEAINCGEPGGRLQGDGRYTRDLVGLAMAIAPDFAEKRGRPAEPRRGLFRRRAA